MTGTGEGELGLAAMTGIRFRADIEGLRAVAVLLVIFDHLAFRGFDGGFIGVDVFFVISGYLITSLLAAEYADKAEARRGRGSISISHFYLRRARRILPAALAVIVAILVASHLLLNSLRIQQVQRDAVWAALFGSNINFIRQANDYFAAGLTTSSPFNHYWSLAVEEQFYFVWPVLFLLVATCARGLAIFGKPLVGGCGSRSSSRQSELPRSSGRFWIPQATRQVPTSRLSLGLGNSLSAR